jgi:hypothetical protein
MVPSLNAPANTREGTFLSLVSGVPSRHKQSSEADQKEKGEGRTGLPTCPFGGVHQQSADRSPVLPQSNFLDNLAHSKQKGLDDSRSSSPSSMIGASPADYSLGPFFAFSITSSTSQSQNGLLQPSYYIHHTTLGPYPPRLLVHPMP